MQFETPTRMISFLYQNHQDTPSEIRDLYESISMPDSQPLFGQTRQNTHYLQGYTILSPGDRMWHRHGPKITLVLYSP
jgi:hypothetical protein